MRLVCDLDGTLCEMPPGSEDYTQARPIQRVISCVNEMYAAGWEVWIDTARASGADGERAFMHDDEHARDPVVQDIVFLTQAQLAQWGVRYHRLRLGRKLPAQVYFDDRALNPLHMDAQHWQTLLNLAGEDA